MLLSLVILVIMMLTLLSMQYMYIYSDYVIHLLVLVGIVTGGDSEALHVGTEAENLGVQGGA